jgi:hypothetical protein
MSRVEQYLTLVTNARPVATSLKSVPPKARKIKTPTTLELNYYTARKGDVHPTGTNEE